MSFFFQKDPLWSSRLLQESPDVVKTAHKNFLRSGAQCVLTTTYHASIYGFTKLLNISEEDAKKLFHKAVFLARQACTEVHQETGAPQALVFGSLGPYGIKFFNCSEYSGSYKDEANKQIYQDWHRPHIQELVSAGVDLVSFETFPLLCEAEAVIELVEKEFPQTKLSICFSCKNGSDTCGGDKFCDAIQTVSQSDRVVAMGVNCTPPQYVTPLLKSLAHLNIQKPLIVKPNSGEKWQANKGWLDAPTGGQLYELVEDWLQAGASWIGGCCRTYPDDIRKLRQTVDPNFTCYGTVES